MEACFMPSCKRQSSGRERKILKKSKKSKNTVKRTLALYTTIYVHVCRLYLPRSTCIFIHTHTKYYLYDHAQ